MLSLPLALLLFLSACVGHGYLLMLFINITYSRPFHRKVLKILRAICALCLVAGPVGFGLAFGLDLVDVSQSASATGALVAVGYAWACVAAGGLVFPVVTALRFLRRPPSVVVAEQAAVWDVEAELGHRPIGDGKHKHLAEYRFLDLFKVEFTTLTLAVPGLPPAWDGLSILHLSDLHFFGTPAREYFESVVRRCLQEAPPDLLVVTGDIIDDNRFLDWIGPVLGPLRWNAAAVAVLGNHDWWQDADAVRDRLTSLGMTVLGNRWQAFDVRGDTLVAVGHEGPWFRPPPDMIGAPAGFRLLVSHSPDNIGWARRNNCRLMLSGHNHGGQIRLPIIGSMFVPSRYSRSYDMGTFHEPPTVLHVNRGLSGKEPLRFRCRPQVTRIVLNAREPER